MVRSGCQSIASPQATPLTMGVVGACVIMRRYRGGCDPLVLDRTFSTYVVSWQPRSNMTEEMQARSLDVFGKWSPAAGTNFLQFWGESTALGGFAVVETDDPALLARDTAIFSTFFDMTVYPVLDVQDAARIGGEASSFLRSA
jgi:hypothetical protein